MAPRLGPAVGARRRLSSSVLKPIQSRTRITMCGVRSLKKKGERKSLSVEAGRGSAFMSMTTAVRLKSGSRMSRFSPCRLAGGTAPTWPPCWYAPDAAVGDVQPQERRRQPHVIAEQLHVRALAQQQHQQRSSQQPGSLPRRESSSARAGSAGCRDHCRTARPGPVCPAQSKKSAGHHRSSILEYSSRG